MKRDRSWFFGFGPLRAAVLGALLLPLLVLLTAAPVSAEVIPAMDAESCLSCHRFPGLSRIDGETGELRLFFCSERYYADRQGPHSRLECTDCHPRDEVEVIPHRDTTPVDCTRTCHLMSSSGAAVEFSHSEVAERLIDSVHNDETLDGVAFAEPLLRPGQSNCLLCHDQPKYRVVDNLNAHHRGFAPETRCETCHDESLPVDSMYYLQHTAGRLDAARPARQLAEVCAICHSETELLDDMEKHDAVTSYFNSFHGKATLLGSGETPTCLHCHQAEDGNVHGMLSADNPFSMTHPDYLELTCRTPECHPTAVPEFSEAAVHMRIDPRAPTPEYAVVAALALLTIFVMTMYFTQIMLELLNSLLRPHSDEHRELEAIARALKAHPEGRKRLERLTANQRWQHWLLAISFIMLVVTGMPMKFATEPWAQTLVDAFGGLAPVRNLHRVMAVIQLGTFVYHVFYLAFLGVRDMRRRALEFPERGVLRRLIDMVWEFPMMLRPRDIIQYVQLFLHLFGLREHRPPQDKFHFSQKFEYMAVFWGMNIIGLSGIILWANTVAPVLVGGRLLNFALVAHSYEAFLAAVHVAVVHMFAVALSPAVFPLHMGSLTGDMPDTELGEMHSGHLRAVAAELGITVDLAQHPHGAGWSLRKLAMKAYSIGMLAVMCVAAFYVMSVLVAMIQGLDTTVKPETLPVRLNVHDIAMTDTDDDASAGASSISLRRGPAAHYHAVPPWIKHDPGSSCAVSGCHSPLPHGERKEDRAFLNMHSTFVDCQVCHLEEETSAEDIRWLSLADRAPHDTPSILGLAAALDPPLPTNPVDLRRLDERLQVLLVDAVEVTGSDAELRYWLLGLRSSRLGGPKHRMILEQMRERIFLHGHGEYGAKLGREGVQRVLDAQQQAAADRLVSQGASMSDELKEPLTELVHRGLARPEVGCSNCHSDDPDWVDYGVLGYSEARAASLRSSAVVRQSLAVERGETFHLPTLLLLPEVEDEEAEGEEPPTESEQPEEATP